MASVFSVLSILTGALALSVGVTDSSAADTLPGVTYFGSVDGEATGEPLQTYYIGGTGAFQVISDGQDALFVAQGAIWDTHTPVAAVSVRMSSSPGASSSGGGSFGLIYYFEISGPAATVPIQVISAGQSSILADGPGVYPAEIVSQAYLGISSSAGTLTNDASQQEKLGYSYDVTGSDHFSEDGIFLAKTNQEYQVLIRVYVDGAVYGAGGFISIYASIDPQILIAPGTPNSDGYSLMFSPRVGDGPITSIPEPSTWAMMFLGFAGLGGSALRNRKRQTTLRK